MNRSRRKGRIEMDITIDVDESSWKKVEAIAMIADVPTNRLVQQALNYLTREAARTVADILLE